jgi:O-6-methylguanine DNA methyltransferase
MASTNSLSLPPSKVIQPYVGGVTKEASRIAGGFSVSQFGRPRENKRVMIYYANFESPVAPLLAAVTEKGLALLEFSRHRRRRPGMPGLPPLICAEPSSNAVESAEKLAPYLDQLRQYFAGERREFTLPLDLHGTEFQLRCWRALLEIGYGEVRTYAQLARAVGSPNGFRAVGAANGANPVSIIVPCHRVIASDGTLGGYGGGLDVKEKLLRLEGGWPIDKK